MVRKLRKVGIDWFFIWLTTIYSSPLIYIPIWRSLFLTIDLFCFGLFSLWVKFDFIAKSSIIINKLAVAQMVERWSESEGGGGKAEGSRVRPRPCTTHLYFIFYLFYILFLRISLFTPKVINLILFFLNLNLGLFILAGFMAI